MPLYKRKPFEPTRPDKHHVLKDSQEVFFCELSKEIFESYEEYFARTMLFNSTIWTCALSGRPNLTYGEALESEKKHRKMIEAFPNELKGPVIYIANLTKRSSISDMVDDVFNFVHTRFFKSEIVMAKDPQSDHYVDCEIVGFVVSTNIDTNHNGNIPFEDVKYRVKLIENGAKSPLLWTVSGEHIKRRKKKDNSSTFSKDKLKLFLKQVIEYNDIRMLTIKKDAYQKYVTDGKLTSLSSFYVGKQPTFTLSKVLADKNEKEKLKQKEQKKKDKAKSKLTNGEAKATKNGTAQKKAKKGKQTSLDTFVTKDGEQIAEIKKAKKLAEEELKRQKELEAERLKQLAEEKKRQVAEMNQLVQSTVKTMNALKDDLELQDQKPLPLTKKIQTLLPTEFFADALKIQEFIFSFTNILEDKDKFRSGLDLGLMERALLAREIAGPLSDILQVLLGSIFAFQIEETNEAQIEFEKGTITFKDNIPVDQQNMIRRATIAAKWPQKYLNLNMYDLPIDALTLSELLRLHFVSSGARLTENGTKYRFQTRGGFQCTDDPGVTFCVENPHIIRALGRKTVYELPQQDIMSILKCLVAQVSTYSTFRDTIEERLETMTKARIALKNLCLAERKRETTLAAEKKEILEEVKKSLEAFEGTEEDKATFKETLEKKADTKIKQLDFAAEREKKKFEDQQERLKAEIFDYQLYLGSDRAYRSYWVFESLPGLFIEHQPLGSQCLVNPVENIQGLANCAPEKRYLFIKQMLQEKQNNNDKENKSGNAIEPKPSEETISTQPEMKLSQRDLFMCTGKKETCQVHRANDPTRSVWSFLHTEEELNQLIDSLNSRGVREKNLREQLETHKEMILDHMRRCPADRLEVDPSSRDAKIEQLISDRNRTYANANFNYPKDFGIGQIMLVEILNSLLEIEVKIANGQLGTLRVKDRLSWRKSLENNEYQMQVSHLQWGPFGQFTEDASGQRNKIQQNGKKLENGNGSASGDEGYENDEENIDEEVPEEEEKVVKKMINITYEDPGESFGTDSETDDDQMYQTTEYKKQIHDLACALLQIAQSIDPKYFKPPFGNLKVDRKSNAKELNAIKAKHNFDMWCVSLMNCRNSSQLFLHYNCLYDAIKWTRSAQNAKCVCRSSKDPDKLLLCDGCNVGRHIYCLKPKLTKVPDGDWYCSKCKPNQQPAHKKRKTFMMAEDDSDEERVNESESAESESEDDFSADQSTLDQSLSDSQQDTSDSERKVCIRCNKNGRNMFKCCKCSRYYDTKCMNMRSKPDAKWMCPTCTTEASKPKRKRIVEESDSGEESYSSRRSSRTNNSDQRRSSRRLEASPPSNQRLSSKRNRNSAVEDGLLDNALIHKLIEEAMKNQDSWPFRRPVSKNEAPDYFKIIQQPMDLSKIKSNLNQGKYSTNYEVLKDIQLIFNNCATYNREDSDIYYSGVSLESFIANRCKDLNLPFKASTMRTSNNSSMSEEPATKKKRQK